MNVSSNIFRLVDRPLCSSTLLLFLMPLFLSIQLFEFIEEDNKYFSLKQVGVEKYKTFKRNL